MDILYGCKLMVVKEMDPETGLEKATNGKVAKFETPQQVGVKHQWIQGQRVDLRGGDKLVASIKEQDQLDGVDLSLNNAELPGEALALLCGGTCETGKYTAPRFGEVVEPVILELYVARYAAGSNDADSSIVGYRKWNFYHASGKMPDFTAQNRNYLVPQFTIRCLENIKADKSAYDWEDVDALPA